MSTVIAFPAARRKSAIRRSDETVRRRDDAGPVVVILPVVRIERHGMDHDADQGAGTAGPIFGAGPGSR